MKRFAICAIVLAGCYKPSVGDCAYQCAADLSCPGDTTCTAGFCRAPGATDTCASTDAPVGDDASICGWSYQPLTFDPCALPPNPLPVHVAVNATFDSDAGTMDDGTVTSFDTSLVDGGATMVFHFASLTVDDGIIVAGAGSRSIIFAVDGDVVINGTVGVSGALQGSFSFPGPGANTACTVGTGANATLKSGGGGGGLGGNGGKGGGPGGGVGGQIEGDFAAPLRGGCNGGDGANSGSFGPGGGAGGAIQISARGALSITGGSVESNGGGGGGAFAANGGGGGGGSGGTIILEAADLAFAGNARVCANGGGGGGGEDLDQGTAADSGDDGTCTTTAARGGLGAGNGSLGGTGAIGAQSAANGDLSASGEGDGGGGGGVGRIKLRGHGTTTGVPAVVSPNPS